MTKAQPLVVVATQIQERRLQDGFWCMLRLREEHIALRKVRRQGKAARNGDNAFHGLATIAVTGIPRPELILRVLHRKVVLLIVPAGRGTAHR